MIRRSMEEEKEQRQQLGGNPDWMSRLPGELLDVPLWDLALPGKANTRGEVGKLGYLAQITLIVEPTDYTVTFKLCVWPPQGAMTACPSAWMCPPPCWGQSSASSEWSTGCFPAVLDPVCTAGPPHRLKSTHTCGAIILMRLYSCHNSFPAQIALIYYVSDCITFYYDHLFATYFTLITLRSHEHLLEE